MRNPIISIKSRLRYQWIKHHPKQWAEQLFIKEFGRPINWDNPITMPEKGRWIQFFTDTSLWPLYADKYRVREVLNGEGYFMPQLYGVWHNAQKIDFDSLPNSFVLKTNHGSGEVVVVKEKSKINKAEIIEKMQKFLHTPYGVMTAESHYLRIKPCIVAEQLLENTCPVSSSIVDYKFFCSFGIPFMIDVCYDRNPTTHKAYENIYNADWEPMHYYNRWEYPKKNLPCPASYNKMIELCKELVSGFPLIRLDFYDVNGKPYIGEFTLTPSAFDRDNLTEQGLLEMGKYIDLSRIPKSMLK